MAPSKFDKDIKQKVEKRTIQPSDKAWERLSQRLDVEDHKESNKTYWWLIAASVVGILFIGMEFFNKNEQGTVTPKVVDTPKIIEEHTALEKEPDQTLPEVQEVTQEVAITKKKAIKKENIPVEKTEINIEGGATELVNNTVLPKKEDVDIESEKVLSKALPFEEQKIQEVVAQVQELKENKGQVTEAEIEALLQQAQQEIALKKLYDESTGVVDANVLLQEVEEDLDRSFRTKVFEALKESYGTVKSAVASRND